MKLVVITPQWEKRQVKQMCVFWVISCVLNEPSHVDHVAKYAANKSVTFAYKRKALFVRYP